MSFVIKKQSSKKNLSKRFNKAIDSKGVDTMKNCGEIKLPKDALAIQKELRNEWE
jgi:ribosomal protein L32